VRQNCCVIHIFLKLLLILEVFNTVSKAGSYIRELLLTHETPFRIPFILPSEREYFMDNVS